jgi:hypothetical protein
MQYRPPMLPPAARRSAGFYALAAAVAGPLVLGVALLFEYGAAKVGAGAAMFPLMLLMIVASMLLPVAAVVLAGLGIARREGGTGLSVAGIVLAVAELAWDGLAFCMGAGDAATDDAVRAVVRRLGAAPTDGKGEHAANDGASLAAHGRLDGVRRAEIEVEMRRVVRERVAGLLGCAEAA